MNPPRYSRNTRELTPPDLQEDALAPNQKNKGV